MSYSRTPDSSVHKRAADARFAERLRELKPITELYYPFTRDDVQYTFTGYDVERQCDVDLSESAWQNFQRSPIFVETLDTTLTEMRKRYEMLVEAYNSVVVQYLRFTRDSMYRETTAPDKYALAIHMLSCILYEGSAKIRDYESKCPKLTSRVVLVKCTCEEEESHWKLRGDSAPCA